MNRKHFVLYDKHDVKCDSMGLMILDEYIKDTKIKEGVNQNYTFECMMLNEYAKHLPEGAIIKVPTRQGSELFRVRLIEQDMGDSGYTYVYCTQPFFCDMEDNLIVALELNGVTGTTALVKMSESTEVPHNFTFYSNIDDEGYTFLSYQNFVTALIGDIDESFINSWGGELEVNNWTVKMNKRRGEDRGVKIRYRHNLTGLNVSKDYSTVITRIYPISGDGITLDEKYVDSPLVDPLHPVIKKVNFDYVYLTENDGEDGGLASEEEVKAELRKYAEAMFSVGNIDKPEETYQVEFDDVTRTREHYNLAVLDTVFIGDTVEVEHEDMGVTVSTRCVEYEYDPKTDRYLSMTLGTVTGTFSSNTQKSQESIMNKIDSNKQTIQGKLDAAVDHLTSLIQAGASGHVIVTENEILIMDTTDKATAVEVWRFNSGGIGYSNTGYNGPFIGLTKDGKLVINEATAHTLNAALIKTGLLQSADGKSWWNFDNGHFSWADGALSYDGKTIQMHVNGDSITDVLNATFTISASHESQVIPVTSSGKAIDYGDYLFEFIVVRDYNGEQAVCKVTNITPSAEIEGVKYLKNEDTCSMVVNKDTDLSRHPEGFFDVELTILDYVLTKRITWCTVAQGVDGEDGLDGVPGKDGKDGVTTYTWIKYADDANGNGLSNSGTGKAYIGFAYNKTTATESTNPKDYTWSLIKGTDGQPGAPGKDGTTTYTWIKYSDNANGSNMYDTPKDSTKYIGIATNQTTKTEGTDPSAYTWSRFRGEDGLDGKDGLDGVPGQTFYTWLKYADDANGNGMSNSGAGKTYIGFAYNKTTPTESTNPKDYTWSQIKGIDGQPGAPGKDGTTTYTWIKYADNPEGTNMYDIPNDSTKYIGIAINQTTGSEGTNPKAYTWSRFRGDDGVDGISQKHNLIINSAFLRREEGWIINNNCKIDYEFRYIDHPTLHCVQTGNTQATWRGCSSTTNFAIKTLKAGVKYAMSYMYYVKDVKTFDANLSMPTPSNYAFAFEVITQDANGNPHYINPAASISSIVQGQWTRVTNIISTTKDENVTGVKMWLYANGEAWFTDLKLEENTQASDWCGTADESIGRDGVDGIPGQTFYTWIKYADDGKGTNMSDSGVGKAYIGFAYNKTTATESNVASDYMWSQIKGTDGQPGAPGKDGTTTYTWIKYSDNANGSNMYDIPKDSTKYIGIAINQTTGSEGTNPNAYTWSKFRGEDGKDGKDGLDGVPGQTTYTWIKYADDANGKNLSNSPTNKTYIGFAYNKLTPTESTNANDYTWSLIKGTDGQPGAPGKDGVTTYTWIKYSDYSDGRNMYDIPHELTKYIGIAINQTTGSEGTNPSAYTWSKFRGEDGTDGQPGQTLYTWIKYADDANGTNMSDNGTNKKYIGFAYNKTTATESTNAKDYMWSLIKGTDGQPGAPGKDGTTTYTWIKYSDNANGSNMYDIPKDSTKYIGIAINQTTGSEGTNPSAYTWSKFRGDDGTDGKDGKDGITQKHNLIKNSAFLKGTSGWVLNNDCSIDYNFKYGDHPTLHCVQKGITQASWRGCASVTNFTIKTLKAGVKYAMSFMYYVKDVKTFDANLSMSTPSNYAFSFELVTKDTAGNTHYINPAASISSLVQGQWTRVTNIINTNKDVDVTTVKMWIYANGEAWFTDLKLEENTQASEWCGTADESIGQDGVDGQPGHDAQTVSIVASSNVFKSTDGGVTFKPSTITLTPLYQNVSHSKWVYSIDEGANWTTVVSGSNGLSLSGQELRVSYNSALFTSTRTTAQFKVISTNASVYDVITITKISERADLNNVLSTMEMTINQSSTAWQAAFKTSGANNLLKNSDAKFGTDNWVTNGGGVSTAAANAFPFYGHTEQYLKTSFPGGIRYSEDIQLEPNTDYIYEGYVYVSSNATFTAVTPLHFWCWTGSTPTTGTSACTILDYSQAPVAGSFSKCYVHFKTNNVSEAVYMRPFIYHSGTIDLVGVKRMSLKKGSVPTQWTQHPNEVATSAVTISEFGLKATHSDASTYTVMNAQGNSIHDAATGEVLAWMSSKQQWTEAKFDYVYAKNIINTYTGSHTLYVNHSHKGASLGTSDNPFSSFADLKNHLPDNTILTQDLYIIVRDPGFIINESLRLHRISGHGFIKIQLEGQLIINSDGKYNCIELVQIHNWVWIEGVRAGVSSNNTGAIIQNFGSSGNYTKCILATDVDRLEVDRVTIICPNATAVDTERTDFYTYCVDFGNSARAVWLRYQSFYFSSNDCGSCGEFIRIQSGGKAFWGHDGSPTRPSGSVVNTNGVYFSYANCAIKTSARYPGTSTPSAPTGTQNHTQSFNHTSLQSYQYSWSNWSTDGSCKQGSWGYGLRGGHMFFDIGAIRSFLTGTVQDGNTITLTRANSGGLNAQSNVYINGSTCSSANGTPSYSNRTHIGTIGWGEKKTFTLPLAIVQSLKSGTCSSLAVYIDNNNQNNYINITSATITLKCKR